MSIKAKVAANREKVDIIFLLSNKSDKYPIGNWANAPEIVSKKVIKPISIKVKFKAAAYTASNVNTAEWIKPVSTELTTPKGEILYNSAIVKFCIFLKAGGFLLVSKIGTNDKDIKIEIKINGS